VGTVWEKSGDHGHIFPAKPLRNFRRTNMKIPASLRTTFRNSSRFWKITYLQKEIENVLSLPSEDLESTSAVVDRWQQQIEDITKESGLQERLFKASQRYFSNSDWEYLLVDVLQRLNPGWKVERTGGKAEARHGTDILVTIPDVFRDGFYGIAIQVKDYEGFIDDDPIRQILKAKEGYWKDFGIAILEMVNCSEHKCVYLEEMEDFSTLFLHFLQIRQIQKRYGRANPFLPCRHQSDRMSRTLCPTVQS
jgi:Restriction endonuclease